MKYDGKILTHSNVVLIFYNLNMIYLNIFPFKMVYVDIVQGFIEFLGQIIVLLWLFLKGVFNNIGRFSANFILVFAYTMCIVIYSSQRRPSKTIVIN